MFLSFSHTRSSGLYRQQISPAVCRLSKSWSGHKLRDWTSLMKLWGRERERGQKGRMRQSRMRNRRNSWPKCPRSLSPTFISSISQDINLFLWPTDLLDPSVSLIRPTSSHSSNRPDPVPHTSLWSLDVVFLTANDGVSSSVFLSGCHNKVCHWTCFSHEQIEWCRWKLIILNY